MFTRSETTKDALQLIADYNEAKMSKDESAMDVTMSSFRSSMKEKPYTLMTGSDYCYGDYDLPLHDICENQQDCPIEILETLAELCPECLVDSTESTDTPLDLVFEYSTKEEMMRIFNRHKNGYALASRVESVPSEWIDELIWARPQTLAEPDGDGRLPLHEAVDKAAWYFEKILSAWPYAALIPDKDGDLPLHCAASETNWSTEIPHMLVSCFPGTIAVTNARGLTPLEVALDHDNICWKLNLVSLLVERDPGVLQRIGEGGFLPVDRAIRNSRSTCDMIEFLVKEDPATMEPHGSKNYTALHVACKYGPSFVQQIFEYYPGAAMCHDADGNLPLFYLAGNERAPLHSIFVLVRQSMEIFHGIDTNG